MNSIEKTQSAQHQASTGLTIEKIKPSISLGISTMNPKLPKQVDLDMEASFGVSSFCESCGVSLGRKDRKTLSLYNPNGDGTPVFFNTCPLCFYTCNLDQIPHLEKGRIQYQPTIHQIGVFTLMRTKVSIAMLAELHKDDDQSDPVMSEITDKEVFINNYLTKLSSTANRTDPENNGDTVDTFVHMMDLLTLNEYNARHVLLSKYVWLPPYEMVKQEFRNEFNQQFMIFHPNESDALTNDFISRFIPRLMKK